VKQARLISFVVAACALAAGLGGCRNEMSALRRRAEALMDRLQNPSPASSPSLGDAIAQVGGEKITQEEFLGFLDSLPPAARDLASSPAGRTQLLHGYLYQRSVLLLARRAGLEKDSEFQKRTKAYLDGQLLTLYMDRLRAEVSVSSAEVRAYYVTHPQEFAEGPIHAGRIVTKSFEDALKAQELLKGGKSFAAVAQALSIDRDSAKHGGRMPVMRAGQADPVFEKTFRALPKGQVSDVIRTAAGFELIRKDEEIQGPPKPLQAVERDIQSTLQNQKVSQRLEYAKTALGVTFDAKKVESLDLSHR